MTLNIVTKGRGPALVMFHGWGFDHQIWLSLHPELASCYSLYLIDLPGFGESTMMDWGAFKSTLLAQLPHTFYLLGWSLGGLYATRLATEEPNRVSRLMAVCSAPKFVREANWPGIEPVVFKRFQQNLTRNPQSTREEFIRLQTNQTPTGHVYQATQQGLSAGMLALEHWDLREALKTYPHPGCFIFGRLDAIVPVKTMAIMQTHYPLIESLCFYDSAHMPFLSQQPLFLEQLRRFFP